MIMNHRHSRDKIAHKNHLINIDTIMTNDFYIDQEAPHAIIERNSKRKIDFYWAPTTPCAEVYCVFELRI